MRWIICSDMDQFNNLNTGAVIAWNNKFPNGTCDTYATPFLNPVDGRIAFPFPEGLGLDEASVTDLDETWFYPSDPDAQAAIAAKKHYDDVINQGYVDASTGLHLAVAGDDQDAFATLSIAMIILGVPNSYVITNLIKDINKVKHDMTYGQFKQLMAGYIPFCMTLH